MGERERVVEDLLPGGPIDDFLDRTGQTWKLEKASVGGDEITRVVLIAAEAVCRDIRGLKDAVEKAGRGSEVTMGPSGSPSLGG